MEKPEVSALIAGCNRNCVAPVELVDVMQCGQCVSVTDARSLRIRDVSLVITCRDEVLFTVKFESSDTTFTPYICYSTFS